MYEEGRKRNALPISLSSLYIYIYYYSMKEGKWKWNVMIINACNLLICNEIPAGRGKMTAFLYYYITLLLCWWLEGDLLLQNIDCYAWPGSFPAYCMAHIFCYYWEEGEGGVVVPGGGPGGGRRRGNCNVCRWLEGIVIYWIIDWVLMPLMTFHDFIFSHNFIKP